MRRYIESTMAAVAVAALLATPSAATAQEEAQEAEVAERCTVEFDLSEVEPGRTAVRLTALLSTEAGEVQDLKVSEESGLALAAPEDLERVAMAFGEPEEGEEPVTPKPIEIAAVGNQATIWLNTENAAPGTHRVILVGRDGGECEGELTVTERGEPVEPS